MTDSPMSHTAGKTSQEAADTAGADAVIEPLEGWAFRLSRAGVIGLGVSLVIHSLILTAFAVVAISSGGGGGRVVMGTPVEVALVDSAEVVSINEGPLTSDAPGVSDTKNSLDLPPMDIVESAGGSGLADQGDLGGNSGIGLGGAGSGSGIGLGSGSGGAGAGGTSFFGVEARGQRFAFVVDVSGSMDGEKLETLKRELGNAIDRLPENAMFVVLCFDSDIRALNNNTKLIPASGRNKRAVAEAVNALRAAGGTVPINALRTALRNRPRPDAIYFMTDGLFDADVVDDLRTELRSGRNVPIHCITFVDRSSEPLMRKIAEMSDGSYTHVDSIGGGGGRR